jgi:hypothetical protein
MWALRAQGREEAGVAPDVAGGQYPSLQADEHVSVVEHAALSLFTMMLGNELGYCIGIKSRTQDD